MTSKRFLRALRVIGAALGLTWERRVRGVEDMNAVAGVPLIGVLRPAGARAPVFPHLMHGPAATGDDDEGLLSASSGAST